MHTTTLLKLKYYVVLAIAMFVCLPVFAQDNLVLTSKKALVNAVLHDMVFVTGGSFHIGDAKHQKMYPKAIVTLDSYYLDKYATPWYQYKAFYKLRGKAIPKLFNLSIDNDTPYNNGLYPAQATYKQANAFCEWLGQQAHLPISLVTDAQWEYAARSRGQAVEYATNDGTLKPGVNFPNKKAYRVPTGNEYVPYFITSTKVNAFPPNPLGMYGMSGNSGEWVKNYWALLPSTSIKNPQGPLTGERRVIRGTGIEDVIAAFSPKTPNDEKNEYLRVMRLYARTFSDKSAKSPFHFRCAINTDKPLPKNEQNADEKL